MPSATKVPDTRPPTPAISTTRHTPPRSARPLMRRDSLTERLTEARSLRCVTIQGPAGSAKTSSLVAWRHSLLALDYDVAWLSLTPEDDDPTSFLDALLASLATVDPSLSDSAQLLAGRDSTPGAAEHCVITLVRAIAAHRRQLVLMLDDVHLLHDPCVLSTLRWLIEYAPQQLHIALASRQPLPEPVSLSLARQEARGMAARFDLHDLRFSADESARFLREQLGTIAAHDASRLHELTGGWPAGLQLFTVDLRAKQGSGYVPVHVRDAETFASYFEREVLIRLEPADLHLLTCLSACDRFCGALGATLLATPDAGPEIARRLASLALDGLFLFRISDAAGDSTWYRLHPLLRQVLQARAARLPDADRHRLHTTAWHWLTAHGLVEEAVGHAVCAGSADAAADMVEQAVMERLKRGELSRLAALLRRLPAATIAGRFRLELAMAYLHMYAGEGDALEASLMRLDAWPDAPDASRQRRRYVLAVLRGGLALVRDDTDAVAALLPELHRPPPWADDFAFTARANILSWMHIYRGEYGEARQVIEDGAQCDGAPRGILLGRCMGGMTRAAEGDVLLAERIFRDVLAESEQQDRTYAGVACMAAALLGEAQYELNDVDAAAQLLAARVDMLERISIPDTVLRALQTLSRAEWLGGRRTEALACLDRLERYAQRRKTDRLLATAQGLRVRCHLEAGETDAAASVMRGLDALAAKYRGATLSTAWEVRVCADLAATAMHLHHNDFDAALARLAPLQGLSRAGGRWCRVAALHVLMAIAETGRGDAGAARAHLVEALRLGHRLGLVRSLLDVSPQVEAMMADLSRDPSLDPVLGFYAQRLANHAGQGTTPPAHPAPSRHTATATLSERENEVLMLLTQAMPNKKIARVLNVSVDTVKYHLRNVYAKLGVGNRDEAVTRLREAQTPRLS
ncbi:LuxR C-terminal-related transcriptional regulator [Cupriavidus numazuensis]|uniref:HTH-type transcriptional regulator MalT n=1 Tax=Cupriavidus numazuensis TaxID=221992 RepID=A0ABM8TU82_9BURK|nr:LuxR C-terminal-related transcriptional regulator [Cupriavidus numazuensis]CAG2160096.1 HTH-type transcriptional regulator MalT [Cupriavidus numazuensis]